MNLDFVAEVWDALKSHVDLNERKDAADTLVNILIDNSYETDDIKESFRGDKEVLQALKYYADQHDTDEEEEFYDEDQDDEWD